MQLEADESEGRLVRGSSPFGPVAAHLKAHGVLLAEQRAGVTEKLLGRMPPPPDGRAFYEFPDCGRKSVAGLRFRKGRKKGVSILLTAKRPDDGRWQSVQVTLGRWLPDAKGLSLTQARDEAAVLKKQIREGHDPRPAEEAQPAVAKPITLREGYELYQSARTGRKRKPLSAKTQSEYRRIMLTALRKFIDRTFVELGDDPRDLIEHFNLVSEMTPVEANTQMRVLRAVWNRTHKMMPSKVPAAPAIWDQNETEPRDAGFVTKEVARLWREIMKLPGPIDRKAALTMLFLGLREGAVLAARREHINTAEHTLLVPWTKAKTLVLPLSPVAESLLLAEVLEHKAVPDNPYIFPSLRGARPRKKTAEAAETESWCHIDKFDLSSLTPPAAYVTQKGDEARVHPHVFRHTFRTLATSARVSEIAIRLLMGHSLRGDVSFDYLTEDLDWLRAAQNDISAYILKAAGLPADFVFASDCFVVASEAE